MLKYDVILVCAGHSNRFIQDKIIISLKGKPVIWYSLIFFLADANCQKIIILCNENNQEFIQEYITKNFPTRKDIFTIELGGNSRTKSVQIGLGKVINNYVIIHDGARPFINLKYFKNILNNLKKYDGVSLACEVTNTIKQIDQNKIINLDRNSLLEIITPQGFCTQKLKEAFNLNQKFNKCFFDDLGILEEYFPDAKVNFIKVPNKLIKITFPIDLQIAKIMLDNNIYE